jgi:hypothetical protein
MSKVDRRRVLRTTIGEACAGLLIPSDPPLHRSIPTSRSGSSRHIAAGGATDTVARLLGNWIAERLGASVIVETKPGLLFGGKVSV